GWCCCARCAAGRSDMTTLARRVAGTGSFYSAVVVLVLFAAFPFYWMLITTFKTDGDLYNLESIPYWFNGAPTLEHLEYLFDQTLFLRWLGNTAVIGGGGVACTLRVCLSPGDAPARGPRGSAAGRR